MPVLPLAACGAAALRKGTIEWSKTVRPFPRRLALSVPAHILARNADQCRRPEQPADRRRIRPVTRSPNAAAAVF